MPKPLQNPEQELRFTRAAQALPFWWATAVLLAASVTMLATCWYRDVNPDLPHPLWALVPVLFALVTGRWALRMTRHAYLILTPMGLELFPLLRPAKNMRLLYWSQLAEAEVNEGLTRLTLHYDSERSGGVHLSLRPIPLARRKLLIQAVMRRLEGHEVDKK